MKQIGQDRSWEYWLDGGVTYVRENIPADRITIVEWKRMVNAPLDKAETNVDMELRRSNALEGQKKEAESEFTKLAIEIGNYVKNEIEKVVEKVKKQV